MKICENEKCKKEHNGSFGSGRFCSRTCANSNRNRQFSRKNKTCRCVLCSIDVTVCLNHPIMNVYCASCKKKKLRKICSVCGDLVYNRKECKRPDICTRHNLLPFLSKYFGLDFSKKGTHEIYREYDKAVKRLEDDYWIEHLSTIRIAKKRIPNATDKDVANIHRILKSLHIKTRTLNQAGTNAILQLGIPENSNWYHTGRHTSWDNKTYYYRSSYELDFMEQLDSFSIAYEVEPLQIQYWDTNSQSYRIAVPDFLLSDYNMIVEIKSNWTLDKESLIDKMKEYVKLGYTSYVVLEKEHVLSLDELVTF